MRRLIQIFLVVSVVLGLLLGLFQLASGPVVSLAYMGGAEPNVGWNGKPAAAIAAPFEVVCYDGFRVSPLVGWNG